MDAEAIRASYDTVAEAYAATFFDELTRKPFDCVLLDEFASACASVGKAFDVGCGPGHVARYLSERGVDVTGFDLSPGMVQVAQQLNASLDFTVGDMRHLGVADASLAGIAAFYSVIHIPRGEVPEVISEFHRTLLPGGRLLMSVHGGTGDVHREEFLGDAVPFEATLFTLGEITSVVEAAGFWVDEARQRVPYEFEHPTPRIYLAAHR